MTEYREIIRRFRAGMGLRGIQRDTGMHRTVARAFRKMAEVEGWLDPERELPSEKDIQKVRGRALGKKSQQHPLWAYLEEFRQWVKAEYSFVVMHQLVKDRYPCSEATVRRFVQKCVPSGKRVVMARETQPGEDMEVDFGYLGITYDRVSCRNRRTFLFSGRLRHSRLAYREATFDQKGRTFFLGHMHAYEYFGGVARKTTPDNLKAAVIKASYQEPLVNRVYHNLAEHYGFLISPCPPRDPRKKGGVENDIKYVKRNFWPLFVERQRAMGHEVPIYQDLIGALESWTREVSEPRIISGVGRTPREIFESEERRQLLPLPSCRWDPLSWAQPIVGTDFLVQFEKAFYSVPYQLIGKRVVVMGSLQQVRIFDGVAEIALHQRAEKPWQTVRNPLHAPPYLQEYLESSSEGLIHWAHRIGDSVGQVAQLIMADKAVDGMRPLRALLRLAQKYPAQRMERACARALRYDTASYSSVKAILARGLEQLPLGEATEPSGQKVFRFQRGGQDFDFPATPSLLN